MSHCAISPALDPADELHPDLVAVPMQEDMQTDKKPSSFRVGRFQVQTPQGLFCFFKSSTSPGASPSLHSLVTCMQAYWLL